MYERDAPHKSINMFSRCLSRKEVDTDPDKASLKSKATQAARARRMEKERLDDHARLTRLVEKRLCSKLAASEMTFPLVIRVPKTEVSKLRRATEAVLTKLNAKTPKSEQEYCINNVNEYVGMSSVTIVLKNRKFPA